MAYVIGGLAIAIVLFVIAAEKGEGLPYRLVQAVYNRIGSLDGYVKSRRRYASAREIIDAAGETRLSRTVRQLAPSQEGWFSALPTDKGTWHDYVSVYDRVLAPYRERTGIRLLEVGVKKGGSLVLWRELFDETAFIYGIDVNPAAPTFPRDAHMKVLVLDSRDIEAVHRALADLTFDIIIDDGLHTPEAQRATYEALRPFLAPHGVYLMEDVCAIDRAWYAAQGLEVTEFPDPSGQRLVMLRPPGSLAPSAAAGLALSGD